MSDITLAIVEDQRRTREGLGALLEGTAGFRLVGLWRTMEEALAELAAARPAVVLLDIGLPGMSGIEGVRRIRAEHPDTNVVMLTVHGDNDSVFEAICAGACGYLLKDTPPDRLREAVREASTGGAPMSADIARRMVAMFRQLGPVQSDAGLSPREREVLQLFANGHSYKTAAAALDLSIDTLRFHVRGIYGKLHVNSKAEAVLKAFRTGLLK